MSAAQILENRPFQTLEGANFDFSLGASKSFYLVTNSKIEGTDYEKKCGETFYNNLFSYNIYNLGGKPIISDDTSIWEKTVREWPTSLTYSVLPMFEVVNSEEFPGIVKS